MENEEEYLNFIEKQEEEEIKLQTILDLNN